MQGLGANLHNRNKVKKTFDLAPHRVHLGWGQRKVCQPCEVLDSGLCHWGCFSTLATCAARHQLLHGPLSLWRYLRVDQRRWVSVIHSPTMCIQHAHHRIGLSRRTRTQEEEKCNVRIIVGTHRHEAQAATLASQRSITLMQLVLLKLNRALTVDGHGLTELWARRRCGTVNRTPAPSDWHRVTARTNESDIYTLFARRAVSSAHVQRVEN